MSGHTGAVTHTTTRFLCSLVTAWRQNINLPRIKIGRNKQVSISDSQPSARTPSFLLLLRREEKCLLSSTLPLCPPFSQSLHPSFSFCSPSVFPKYSSFSSSLSRLSTLLSPTSLVSSIDQLSSYRIYILCAPSCLYWPGLGFCKSVNVCL